MQTPDWDRLHKALQVEADRGFGNLAGRQYRFHEFLCLSFGQLPPDTATPEQCHRWHKLAREFAMYPDMTPRDRQQLLAVARRLLRDLHDYAASVNAGEFAARGSEVPDRATAIPSQVPPPASTVRESDTPYIPLDRPLQGLGGLQTRHVRHLVRLGLHSVRDALFYYPRDYVDYARQVSIAELVAGETVTIVGMIAHCSCFTSPRNPKLSIFELQLRDRSGRIKISRFYAGARYANRGWQEKLKRQYQVGSLAAASGLVKKNRYGLTLDNPEIEVIDSSERGPVSEKIGRVLPVYPLAEGVPADAVRRAIAAALPAAKHLSDPLPATVRQTYDLLDLSQAIADIHFPVDTDAIARARRRLVFDEFFFLQLGFLRRRRQLQAEQTSAVLDPSGHLINQFKTILPFELTGAQKRVISDILRDLQSSTPMNRLVQGDVGSGKTVVAVFAILAAIQSGFQAALMAPTEVLAEQHYRKLVEWFNLLHLPVELLTGSTRAAKRKQIRSQLETGELPLLVGTHALIQDYVNFQRLGLAVIDEQHRFGVEQRSRLLDKGQSPHVLTMTATPIPRTLALTLHGDLDVSQIDELPPGRQEIQTTVLTSKERSQAYDTILREIVQGRQAYIVLPLVEESEKLDVRSAIEERDRLQAAVFPEFNVGLLHGRMSSADKEAAIAAFRANETQIIVSTTVIEVGVDVPNATVMQVENAERFGLSQLHQLRGRVGRGSHKSYCLLVSASATDNARQRLGVLTQSQDGFFIAEMDLRLRGPGEVLGRRQSGLPDFALASLVDDQDVLDLAREAAEELLDRDRDLGTHPDLRAELERRYQRMTGGPMLT
ncbi:ATP-dependent DNA helicase RecG [Rubidibacter lacunae KORDI 51-2]|uniref:ATP-dependent DNA helicase RecG n=1 Tax=Rubidibacter lacunae KORDI 51-2 TaxID=582515 RepID=U5DJZ3_9CHRO|nr:ATP-dependent DNA helicase RecG [Rubidibacter lacunae]ERN42006.1 ATP-dependent DNA helicase RecG [Rubidibacter lacunae KORDI 51-2]